MNQSLTPHFIFELLFERYGPRGWWPLIIQAGKNGFDDKGYHPGNYTEPKHYEGVWEVVAGSILTQNTAWSNVEKSLNSLAAGRVLTPEAYLQLGSDKRIEHIRSAGYYNQKACRLASLARYFIQNPGGPKNREELLGLNGVGPETADSMLLYGWHREYFVVDLYTTRFLTRTGALKPNLLPKDPRKRYEYVQKSITSSIRTLPGLDLLSTFKEDHALILHHAKAYCSAKPRCPGCPLEQYCPKLLGSV